MKEGEDRRRQVHAGTGYKRRREEETDTVEQRAEVVEQRQHSMHLQCSGVFPGRDNRERNAQVPKQQRRQYEISATRYGSGAVPAPCVHMLNTGDIGAMRGQTKSNR